MRSMELKGYRPKDSESDSVSGHACCRSKEGELTSEIGSSRPKPDLPLSADSVEKVRFSLSSCNFIALDACVGNGREGPHRAPVKQRGARVARLHGQLIGSAEESQVRTTFNACSTSDFFNSIGQKRTFPASPKHRSDSADHDKCTDLIFH